MVLPQDPSTDPNCALLGRRAGKFVGGASPGVLSGEATSGPMGGIHFVVGSGNYTFSATL